MTLRRCLEALPDGRTRVRKVIGRHVHQRIFTTRKAAEAYLAHLELVAAGVPLDAEEHTIGSLCRDYEARMRRLERSEETIDYYAKLNKSIKRELGEQASPFLAPHDVDGYVDRRRADGAGAAIILKELRALQSYMRAAGLTPSWRVPDLRPVRRHRRLPPDGEVARLLEAADPITRRALLLGLLTGIRPSEVLAVQWSDVDLEAGTVDVTLAKVAWTNSLPIVPTLAAELASAGTGPVIPVQDRHELARLVRLASIAAGIPHWHGVGITRHLAVTWALDAGYTEGQVALLTGHVAGVTRRHYAHSSGSLVLKREMLTAIEARLTLAVLRVRGTPEKTGKRTARPVLAIVR
ncbi:MAG: hypothetical protein HY825_13405 [Acidobacteria bacterium]|nr:hypothetical protein [Acidobacteriota bacterium]